MLLALSKLREGQSKRLRLTCYWLSMLKLPVFGRVKFLGLISFVATAASLHGVKPADGMVQHEGWGLFRDLSIAHIEPAVLDFSKYRSSLQLLAFRVSPDQSDYPPRLAHNQISAFSRSRPSPRALR